MTPIASLIVWGSSFVQPKPQEKNGDESTRKDEIPESRKDSNFLLEPSRCRLVEQIGGFKDLKAQQAWWDKKLKSQGIYVRASYLPHHLKMILNNDLTQATFDEIRKFVNPTSISLENDPFIPASDLTLPSLEHYDRLESISVKAKEVKNLDSLASTSISTLTLNSPNAIVKFSDAWKHNHTLKNVSITAEKIENLDALASCPIASLKLEVGEVKFSEVWKDNQTLTSLSLDEQTKLDSSVWNLANLNYIYHMCNINLNLFYATTPAMCHLNKLHKTCRWLIHNRLATGKYNASSELITLARNWAEKDLDPQTKASFPYPAEGYIHNVDPSGQGGVCYTAPFEESAVRSEELASRLGNLKKETNPSTIQINTVERGRHQNVKDHYRLHFTVQLSNETFYKYFESYFLSYFHSPAEGEKFQRDTLQAVLHLFKETAAFKQFCTLYGENAATLSFQDGKIWIYERPSKDGYQTILDIKGAWYDPKNKKFTISETKTDRSTGIHLNGHA